MVKIIISLSDAIREAYAGSVFRYWIFILFGSTTSFLKDHLPIEEYHRICEKNKK